MTPSREHRSASSLGNEPVADIRESSLRLLEFDLVKEVLAGHTSFSMSREMALELVPSYGLGEVAGWQQETNEARRFLEGGSSLDLAQVSDLRQVLQRASLGGVLTGEELRQAYDTLKVAREARAAVLRRKDAPALAAMAGDLPLLQDLERELVATIGKSGEVLDGASAILKSLRVEARSAYQHLMASMERTVRRVERQGILQEPIITQRNGRMVLLVKTEMKHRLPGIVHDVSDSGATLFVEPMAAVGLGNLWRELRMAEEREEDKVLRSLSAKVEAHGDQLLRGLGMLARLDLAMARARYSLAINGVAPTVMEGERQYILLLEARHPLLEGEVVPVTLKIGDGWSLLLITGPNAGGKTVALKMLGLLALMAQAGLHVPAREATFSIFDGVYADIGDQQSIQRSQSTFSSHVENLQAIMERATGKSLALIDELGTSTDPEEGAALAKAILGYFLRQGITLAATTHQREVAAYVQEQPGMMNASVELDPRTLAPTYRLTMGLPGRSYALTIASQLGLEVQIVEEARVLLSPAHQSTEAMLKELQVERHLAAEQRREAEKAVAEAEARRVDLEEQLAAVQDSKAEMIEEARHQIQQRVAEFTKRLGAAERAPDQPGPRPTIAEARKEVAQVRRELASPDWRPPPSRRGDWLRRLQSGDRVYLRGVPQPVEVVSPPDDEGRVEVLLGTMRARLPVYQLDRPASAHTTSSRDGIYYARSSKRTANTELNLQGVRVEEALERVEGFLNDATLGGLSSVRIIHGVGTGALRSAIREYLGHHPLIKAAGPDENMASDGATVVELT